MELNLNFFLLIVGFSFIALASKQIGQYFAMVRLPLISGFLFTGMIAGPHVLGFIPKEATKTLLFIDQLSLSVIAFAAGGELIVKELKSSFRSIKWVTTGLVVTTFILGSLSVVILADHIPFMRSMPPEGRIAVAILAGTILVARSPSSAIAVVNELRARGPFTQTVLGVTMIMDVVVIVLFAINSSITDVFLTGLGVSLKSTALVCAELLISLAVAGVLWQALHFILSRRASSIIKTGMVLLAGYGVFVFSAEIRRQSHDYMSLEVFLEPLLICMVGGFLVANFGGFRDEFKKILHDIGPPVYVMFFTLTGASLALDMLAGVWPIALALFLVRLLGISIGSFCGGVLAKDPMRRNRIGWMAYVTQAGIGLGLAKQVAMEFPEWGTDFATMIISVIVINQITGPILFKWAIHLAGEAHTYAQIHFTRLASENRLHENPSSSGRICKR